MNDGWEPTRHRSKRRRGAKCATKRVEYLLIGGRLLVPWFPHRCYGRVERGQELCVKCRQTQAELERQRQRRLKKD